MVIGLVAHAGQGLNSPIDTRNVDNEPKAFNDAAARRMGYLLPLGR